MLSITMMKISHLLDTARDLSGTTLALIAGVPPSTFSDALNDRRPLPVTPKRTTSQQEAYLLELAEKCVAILDAIKPLTIPRGNWQSLRDLVETGKSAEEIRATVTALFEKSAGAATDHPEYGDGVDPTSGAHLGAKSGLSTVSDRAFAG